jgi:flagellar motor switch protein FliG
MSEKRIVLTMYGKGDQIIDISVSLFDPDVYHNYLEKNNAESYCENINRLKLQNDEWIDAKVIQENVKIPLKKPDIKFEIIRKLNRHAMWTILNDFSCGESVLAIALQGGAINDTILKEEFNNPSLRGDRYSRMGSFFYEYEKAGTANEVDIITARKRVVETIKQLIMAGKIVINE